MIIEIGTSDFRTQAGQVDGLFIEPVKEYFDRLPLCRKENVAISNKEGLMQMYFVNPKYIGKNGIPNWIRGCNSINKIHPTVKAMGLEEYVDVEQVKVVRIKSLIDKYDIKEIDLLKVDTEGHYCIIVNDFLDTVDILPKVIQFESNVLSYTIDVQELTDRITALGYKCEQVNFDMVCKL